MNFLWLIIKQYLQLIGLIDPPMPPQEQPLTAIKSPSATLQQAQPSPVPPQPKSAFTPQIILWAKTIQIREGGHPYDPNMKNNNPGNIRATKYGRSLGAISGISPDGFCVYRTYDIGFHALCQLLEDACNGELVLLKNTMSILQFTKVYAEPPNDDYALAVAQALGVPVETQIKNIPH